MVEAALEEADIAFRCLGQTTWRRQDLLAGLEADECYYIQNEPAILGKSDIDLTADLPPDLAIEVDNTSSFLKRMEIYAALGVPEVWRYDGTRLTIHRLVEGEYEPQDASLALPMLRRDDVLRFMQMGQTMRDPAWIRGFRQWLREQLG